MLNALFGYILSQFDDEAELQNAVLNQIMVIWSGLSSILILFLINNFIHYGFLLEDFIFLLIIIIFFVFTLYRKKLSPLLKALILIFVNAFTGIVGFYTAGILRGSIFSLPLASVIMSLFFSRKLNIIFTGAVILAISAMSYGFYAGYIVLENSVEEQIINPVNWFIYVIGLLLFLVISSRTIFIYRKTMVRMMEKIQSQQLALEKSNEELSSALKEIKTLSGLLPICSHCKKIRDEKGYWKQIESYIETHSDVQFTHGLCDDCAKEIYGHKDWFKDED